MESREYEYSKMYLSSTSTVLEYSIIVYNFIGARLSITIMVCGVVINFLDV